MSKSKLYYAFFIIAIHVFSQNIFAAPRLYRCAANVISIYDQLVAKSLPLFSAQYKETMALFRSLGINELLEDIKVIYTIYLREQQPNPISLIDLYLKKNKQYFIYVQTMDSSVFANVMKMHDGSTFKEFASNYEVQEEGLREEKLKTLLMRLRSAIEGNQGIVDICTKLELNETLHETLSELASLE